MENIDIRHCRRLVDCGLFLLREVLEFLFLGEWRSLGILETWFRIRDSFFRFVAMFNSDLEYQTLPKQVVSIHLPSSALSIDPLSGSDPFLDFFGSSFDFLSTQTSSAGSSEELSRFRPIVGLDDFLVWYPGRKKTLFP